MSSIPTPAHARNSTWEVDQSPYPIAHRLALFLPGLIAAVVVAAIVGLIVSWPAGILALAIVLSLSFLVDVTAGSWAVRRVGAKEPATPRLSNIASGLAASLGVAAPTILVLERGGPNALVIAGRGAPTIIVTRSLIDDFTRTELEGAIAHCLIRASEGRLRYAATAARMGRWAFRFAPSVGGADDVHASALTRYPPALASAISKADRRVDDRFGPLWFVWDGVSHVPAEQRMSALLDL
ncbi:MAG: hypothetical protein QOG54_1860 [Actinomycetota bacterium]|jgi:hypothetical protein|nr:hypothetical protein [Actinomycetota bacterium]